MIAGHQEDPRAEGLRGEEVLPDLGGVGTRVRPADGGTRVQEEEEEKDRENRMPHPATPRSKHYRPLPRFFSSSRTMMSFWIWVVPAPNSMPFTSRYIRSMGNSLM